MLVVFCLVIGGMAFLPFPRISSSMSWLPNESMMCHHYKWFTTLSIVSYIICLPHILHDCSTPRVSPVPGTMVVMRSWIRWRICAVTVPWLPTVWTPRNGVSMCSHTGKKDLTRQGGISSSCFNGSFLCQRLPDVDIYFG